MRKQAETTLRRALGDAQPAVPSHIEVAVNSPVRALKQLSNDVHA